MKFCVYCNQKLIFEEEKNLLLLLFFFFVLLQKPLDSLFIYFILRHKLHFKRCSSNIFINILL